MSVRRKIAVLGGGSALAMSVTLLAHLEGERVNAYFDPVGIPTICYGETENVEISDKATHEQCVSQLRQRANEMLVEVYKDVGHVPDATAAALVSFCYNVGPGNCQRSESFRLIREGEREQGCNALMNWQRAGNKVHLLRGRREEERKLCLQGFNDAGLLSE